MLDFFSAIKSEPYKLSLIRRISKNLCLHFLASNLMNMLLLWIAWLTDKEIMATSSGSQQGPNEEFRLIRGFSSHAIDTEVEVENVIRTVNNHVNQDEDGEVTRLRKYFNDVELSRLFCRRKRYLNLENTN